MNVRIKLCVLFAGCVLAPATGAFCSSIVVNGNFAIPTEATNAYVYNPTNTGVGWTFTSQSTTPFPSGSGITFASPTAPFKFTAAPGGSTQVAFLQGTSVISEMVNLVVGNTYGLS